MFCSKWLLHLPGMSQDGSRTDGKQPRRTTDVCCCGVPCLPAAAAAACVRAGLIIKTTVRTRTVTALKAVNDLFCSFRLSTWKHAALRQRFPLNSGSLLLVMMRLSKRKKKKQHKVSFSAFNLNQPSLNDDDTVERKLRFEVLLHPCCRSLTIRIHCLSFKTKNAVQSWAHLSGARLKSRFLRVLLQQS